MPPGISSHRQRQAQATRDQILAAAREAFREHGYGATLIADIARRAGVGVSTVYAVFTNKRGILRALREGARRDSGERELLREAEAEPDPALRLEMLAHAVRRQWETQGALYASLDGAAMSDPDAASERREALAARRRELAALVHGLNPHLRSGLGLDAAVAIVLALTRREVYAELVDEHRWGPDLYQAWLAAALAQQLLG